MVNPRGNPGGDPCCNPPPWGLYPGLTPLFIPGITLVTPGVTPFASPPALMGAFSPCGNPGGGPCDVPRGFPCGLPLFLPVLFKTSNWIRQILSKVEGGVLIADNPFDYDFV